MKPICAEWEERLSLYVDGLLNPFDENAVKAHLSRCEACRMAVMLWQEIGQSVRRLPRELPPADLRARILAATTRKPSLVQRLRWWQLAPALGVGLLLAWWTLPRSSSVPTHTASQPEPASVSMLAPSDPSSELDRSDLRPSAIHPADSDVRVVIVVQPAPTPRWRESSPRWIITTRAPTPLGAASTTETTVPASSYEIALSTSQPATSLPVTEVADLPVQTESAGVENLPNPPERPNVNVGASPTAETTALSRWSEQFNQQLQQENNRRTRLKQAQRDSRNRFFVPILSWNIK